MENCGRFVNYSQKKQTVYFYSFIEFKMRLARLVILLFSILLITQSIFGSQLKHDHVGRNSGLSTNDTEVKYIGLH